MAQGIGGGTRIGESLATFNRWHARRVVNSRTAVMIVSDGYDTGEPERLGRRDAPAAPALPPHHLAQSADRLARLQPAGARHAGGAGVLLYRVQVMVLRIATAANAKVMKDPRIAKMMNPKAMPFDGKRMIWGGFESLIEVVRTRPSASCGPPPTPTLPDGHIFEPKAMSDRVEALQSAMHGDRTCRFSVSGAIPSAEASNDPCCPSQRSRREGISEAIGPAVDGWSDCFEHLDVFVLEDRRDRPMVGAAAGMNELHTYDGGTQRDDGKLAQDGQRFDLTLFDTEPLALDGSEQLLDVSSVGDGQRWLGAPPRGSRLRRWTGAANGSAQFPPGDRSRARRGHTA